MFINHNYLLMQIYYN